MFYTDQAKYSRPIKVIKWANEANFFLKIKTDWRLNKVQSLKANMGYSLLYFRSVVHVIYSSDIVLLINIMNKLENFISPK